MTIKTDRELLDLAAKAAGYAMNDLPCHYEPWNPLEDDGDALRLSVILKIDISFFEGYQQVLASTYCCEHESFIDYTDDRAKDVRLAIVTVAASVGATK